MLERLPRWLSLILGLACVLVGTVLIMRPFQSLAVLIVVIAIGMLLTGLQALAAVRSSTSPRLGLALGACWVVTGAIALLWPGLTVQALAIIVGLAVLAGALEHAVNAVRGGADERVASLLLGIASLILGLLALGWPDVTVLVVSIVFGVRMVLFGGSTLFRAVHPRAPDPSNLGPSESGPEVARPGLRNPRSGWRRWSHLAGAVISLVVVLALLGASVTLRGADPSPDAFYDPPVDLPTEPGILLRSESFEQGMPAGTRAWRILYTTTHDDGSPAVASGYVALAADAPNGPRPVIAWAHGTTGVAEGCAPTLASSPFSSASSLLDEALTSGWAIVATDYVGLGTRGPHGYLIGPPAARATLDAVRAARQLGDLSLDDRIVVWGHSQGGHTTLWTGVLAPTYAPDVNVLAIAPISPASDLPALIGNLDNLGPVGNIFGAYAIVAYAASYDEVRLDDYVRPTARLFVEEMASRCLEVPETFVSFATTLLMDRSIWSRSPSEGPVGVRLQENVPLGRNELPMLLGQGAIDPLVLPGMQADYVEARCAEGWQIDYRTYAGTDHTSVIAEGAPLLEELRQWTQDRFDGVPVGEGCS